MKKILIAISISLFSIFSIAQVPCSNMVYGGEFPRAQEDVVILCKREFVIGYSTSKKTLLWAAYVLDPEKITSPNVVNSLRFRLDPSIPPVYQAQLSDYANSGFDRGHMVPFEDMNHDLYAAVDSMMMTNVIPQFPTSNRGIWRVLENKIRNQSLDGPLFVIVGPVFDRYVRTIGNGIPVPTRLYRVVINARNKTSTTYIIPHVSAPISSADLSKFISTRNAVKEITGIELVPAIVLLDAK